MRIELDVGRDGQAKYSVIFEENPVKFYALRYGEPWRDLTGDGMILAMMYHIEELEAKVKELENKDGK